MRDKIGLSLRVLLVLFLIVLPVMTFVGLIPDTNVNYPPMGPPPAVPTGPEQTFTESTAQTWFSSSWGYRKLLSFYEVSGSGTSYQIDITVYYGDETIGIGEVDCESHSQTDFDDIRFTDNDGVTLLSYWREDYTASDNATFWFKVTDDLSSGTVTAYIYYGNAAVSTTSSGVNTFLFFDDFENNNLDRWDVAGGDWSTQGTVYRDGLYAAKGDSGLVSEGVPGRSLFWEPATDVDYDIMVHVWFRVAGTPTEYRYGLHFMESDATHVAGVIGYSNDWIWWNGGSQSWEANTLAQDIWYRLELTMEFAANRTIFYKDRTQIGYHDLLDYTNMGVADLSSLGCLTDGTSGSALDQYQDDYYVRKFIYGEPYVSAAGSEEAEPDPTIDATPTCTNPDESTKLFSMKRNYVFTVNTSDLAGYADINGILFSIFDDARATEHFRVHYVESTDAFTEEVDVGNNFQLVSPSAAKSNADVDLTLPILVFWNQSDLVDVDLYVNVDDALGSDIEYYETSYDIETDVTTTLVLNDGTGTLDHGNYDSLDTVTATGTVSYQSSSTTVSDTCDVWIACSDIAGTPWSDTTLSSGTFSTTVDSDDAVGLDTYWGYVVSDGAGSAGTKLNATSVTDTYIADRIEAYGATVTDGRIDISTQGTTTWSLRYDYLDAALVNVGTFVLNGSKTMDYVAPNTWHYHETKTTVQRVGYEILSVSETTHGITKFTQTASDQNIIWDQTRVVSYTIVNPSADNRNNIGTTYTIDVELHYDYDETDVTDGIVVVNAHSATYQSAGKWRFTDSEATVTSVTYNDVEATLNTYAITVEDNTITQTVIWDQVHATAMTYTGTPDTRINIGTSINYDWTLKFDYDEAAVTDGTVTVNGYSMTHIGSGLWRYTNASALVGSLVLNTIACSGNTYGITSVSNTYSVTMVYDRVQTRWIVANGTYFELDDGVLLTVGLWYDYDDAVITAGTFSLRYGSTYLTLTHLSGGNWTVTDTSATATSRTYNYVNGTATLYGITSVDMDSKSATCHWDRILLTVTITKTWTVVGYNTSITVSGTYQGLGYVWNGTAYLNTSYAAPYYPSQSTYGNYSYVITSITNDDTPLVGFSANDVYCIWDDVVPTTAVVPYWVQPTSTELNYVYIIWGDESFWKWAFNDTFLASGYVLHAYSNGTVPESSGGIYGAGSFAGMAIGFYTADWFYLNLTVNCEITLGGTSYDWEIWDNLYEVPVLHTLQIVSFSLTPTNDYLWIQFTTQLQNASIIVWDSLIDSGTLFTDAVLYSEVEGFHKISLSAIGLHNITICITSTGTLYNKTFTANDWTVWYSVPFTTDPNVLAITVEDWTPLEVTIRLTGTTNAAFSYFVYREGVYNSETGTVSGSTSYSFTIARNVAIGVHNYQVYFNSTTYTGSRWFNITDEVSSTYAWTYVTPFYPDGVGYPLESFQLFINGTQIYDRDWKFYARTDQGYLVTIKDLYGTTLNSTAFVWDEQLEVLVPVYEFGVCTMLEQQYLDFELTGPGGSKYSALIYPGGEVTRFYLHSASTYTYSYWCVANESEGNPASYKEYTGSITVTGNSGLIVISWGIDKVIAEIRLNGGGGGITQEDIKKALEEYYKEHPQRSETEFVGVLAIYSVALIAGAYIVARELNLREIIRDRRRGQSS